MEQARQAAYGVTQDDLALDGHPVAEVAVRVLEVLAAPCRGRLHPASPTNVVLPMDCTKVADRPLK